MAEILFSIADLMVCLIKVKIVDVDWIGNKRAPMP